MHTKNTSSGRGADELRKEYELDYAKSKPNRFASRLAGTTLVVLQPDVAEVFQSSQAVNDLLRSAIAATGVRASGRHSAMRSSGRTAQRSE